jgi:hypothetical protein
MEQMNLTMQTYSTNDQKTRKKPTICSVASAGKLNSFSLGAASEEYDCVAEYEIFF